VLVDKRAVGTGQTFIPMPESTGMTTVSDDLP